ncbi:adenosylcobinamide-phosphate synthase CbiB [Phaeobacter sp. J2-8]|uniref:adenosylcobinamide-phosphate synthase CbiB n=1 Tax=Phaeobacter sp. J2-8 TaxID=2931394 RepID=UPI001FD325C7|nr:adenosylcobinamide-phosphate synthase CbiB [Phaeobacter sp. J2-8]MCJ7874460.1 adenosylcobinamide-phosphate synthase CbiB [Phaeobacter sp. J2-8]
MNFAAMMLIAMALDVAIGWPKPVFQRIGHPVTWLGAAISGLERRLNHPGAGRRARGTLAALLVIALAALCGALLQSLLPSGWLGIVIGGVLAWPLVALRAMHEHVVAVADPLNTALSTAPPDADALAEARYALSMIVGRDPAQLDTAGISRAALESLAENSSDGIVAPLFWGAVAGLPGIAAYKAINTLDSMIGHRTERYEAFGWAAARIDDLVNLIPARLCGGLFALAAGRFGLRALRVMGADARAHRSPNAGWPEAAMAGALDVRLSGPRIYGDHIAREPWLNADARDPKGDDLRRGLALYRRAMGLGALGLACSALIIWSF